MCKFFFINLFLFLTTFSAVSQSLSKQIINSAGLTQGSANNQLSWSMGEPIIGSMTSQDGSVQIGNGYYPSLNVQALSVEDVNLKMEVKIFPNPTTENIYVYHPSISTVYIKITNLLGELIFEKVVAISEPIDISFLATDMYLLTIQDKANKKQNTFKILKK